MKIRKRMMALSIILVFLFSLFLTACADAGEVYDVVSKYEATDEELKILSEGKARLVYDKGEFESTFDYMKYVAAVYVSHGSQKVKENAIGIIIFCIVLGCGLYYFSGNSTTLKRWAWIIGLGGTILVFVAVWGSALMADYLM